MTLTRKHRKQIKRLRKDANELWGEQRDVLDQASRVLRQAQSVGGVLARDEVSPRLKHGYEAGVDSARSAAHTVKHKITDDVVPSVSSAVGAALGAVEAAKNKELRDAWNRVSKAGKDAGVKFGQKVGVIEKKKSPGVGTFLLIGAGVVALAAIGYAAWQTLRADDDLWVEDEPIETPEDAEARV
jgi:hypothetical protein